MGTLYAKHNEMRKDQQKKSGYSKKEKEKATSRREEKGSIRRLGEAKVS